MFLSWVSAQSCSTLCNPIDCSPRGSSVHKISQARTLQWVATCLSRGSSWPRDRTQVSCVPCIAGRFFYLLSHRGSPCFSLTGNNIEIISCRQNGGAKLEAQNKRASWQDNQTDCVWGCPHWPGKNSQCICRGRFYTRPSEPASMGNSQKYEEWKQTQFFHSVLNIEKQECTHKQTKPCMTQRCILHQDGRNAVTKMVGWNKKSFPMGDKQEYINIPQLPFN